ncbi:MAG: pyridoxamine 5'-phosphate oxidase family protein [Alphaproteobacteria bacterium]
MSGTENFYDDLFACYHHAWELIEDGVDNRSSAFHTPVVNTLDGEGYPSGRVVVLRHADRHERNLRFHSDWRGRKIAEISNNPKGSMVFYSAALKIQIRCFVHFIVHHHNDITQKAWSKTRPFSRACYTANPAPGTVLEEPHSGLPSDLPATGPDEILSAQIYSNFSVIEGVIQKMEWLYLASSGHRRAIFSWNEQSVMNAQWVIP